jgi:hypothetical protein
MPDDYADGMGVPHTVHGYATSGIDTAHPAEDTISTPKERTRTTGERKKKEGD